MKPCKCGESSKPLMLGKQCYLCVLKQYPPKTILQYMKYQKAVAIRLSLATPLTKKESLKIINIVGLNKLELLNDIAEGSYIPMHSGNTYYKRIIETLEAK